MPEHGELVAGFAEFSRHVKEEFAVAVPEALVGKPQGEIVDGVLDVVAREKADVLGRAGESIMRSIERFVLLNKIDEKWKDMLYNMDQLRDVIGMRSFAQQDPKLEYKRDATELFGAMMDSIDEGVVDWVFHVTEEAVNEDRLARRWRATEFRKDEVGQFAMAGGDGAGGAEGEGDGKPVPFRAEKKPGRNEPCWCSSGKKYKKCHWPN
jgi:preprotein translocase subunit SecA